MFFVASLSGYNPQCMSGSYSDYLYEVGYNTPSPIGVYALVCVRSSHLYIGSSTNLTRRSAQHFKALEEGIHPNRKLQYEFDGNGASSFSFIVLEYLFSEDRLEAAEQKWINRFKLFPNRLLNLDLTAVRPDWKTIHPNEPTSWHVGRAL